jgi:putative nucleotidyltransferase with HDIG domain
LTIVLLGAGFTFAAPLWGLGALSAVAFLAERESVFLTRHTQVSVAGLPILFTAVVYGPLDAMLVGALALLSDFRRPYARWLIWTSSRAVCGAVAGLAGLAVADGTSSFGRTLLIVGAAAAAYAGADAFFVGVTSHLRRTHAFFPALVPMARLYAVTVPLEASAVAVLVYSYQSVSPWTAAFFFLPALGCQRLLGLYQEQLHLTDELRDANSRLEQANLSFASALVAALDARDHYTAGHSAAVAIYARDIAVELGLGEEDRRLAHLAGLLHDIGKVGLPPGLLEKPGTLTASERKQMEAHSEIGERILRNVPDYSEVAEVVRHHHERFDGGGYPDGIVGAVIPLLSRIIAVADAYSAMTSGRTYRQALSTTVARDRLREGAGGQFDPQVVEAFERVLARSCHTYRVAAQADFAVSAQWGLAAPELASAAA